MHILRKILLKLCVGTCLLEPNVATPLELTFTISHVCSQINFNCTHRTKRTEDTDDKMPG